MALVEHGLGGILEFFERQGIELCLLLLCTRVKSKSRPIQWTLCAVKSNVEEPQPHVARALFAPPQCKRHDAESRALIPVCAQIKERRTVPSFHAPFHTSAKKVDGYRSRKVMGSAQA